VTTTLIYQEILVPRAMAFKENKCFSIRHYQLPLMFFVDKIEIFCLVLVEIEHLAIQTITKAAEKFVLIVPFPVKLERYKNKARLKLFKCRFI